MLYFNYGYNILDEKGNIMKKIMFFGVGDGGCNIVEKIKNKGQIVAKFRGMNVSRDYRILYDLMG